MKYFWVSSWRPNKWLKERIILGLLKFLKGMSMSIPARNKRYKMVNRNQTVELLIYIRFLFSRISKVAKFTLLLLSVDWSDKGRESWVWQNVILQNKTL